jgi:hypothetical protein
MRIGAEFKLNLLCRRAEPPSDAERLRNDRILQIVRSRGHIRGQDLPITHRLHVTLASPIALMPGVSEFRAVASTFSLAISSNLFLSLFIPHFRGHKRPQLLLRIRRAGIHLQDGVHGSEAPVKHPLLRILLVALAP